MGDGTVQLCFTLPADPSPEVREAAVQLCQQMGFREIKVATMERASTGFSVFVIYANTPYSVDLTSIDVVKIAAKKRGITGENLLKLLESRLDNTVFRLGIAPTRSSARQLVSHNHILVNGEIVNIPSLLLKAGDTVAVREKSKSLEAITTSLSAGKKRFSWLDWNEKGMTGTFINYPERSEIPENIKEQLIVELYSK
jgi:ribosomal protein S4